MNFPPNYMNFLCFGHFRLRQRSLVMRIERAEYQAAKVRKFICTFFFILYGVLFITTRRFFFCTQLHTLTWVLYNDGAAHLPQWNGKSGKWFFFLVGSSRTSSKWRRVFNWSREWQRLSLVNGIRLDAFIITYDMFTIFGDNIFFLLLGTVFAVSRQLCKQKSLCDWMEHNNMIDAINMIANIYIMQIKNEIRGTQMATHWRRCVLRLMGKKDANDSFRFKTNLSTWQLLLTFDLLYQHHGGMTHTHKHTFFIYLQRQKSGAQAVIFNTKA